MELIYKYYSPNSNNWDALKNDYFFFCKAEYLNDPFDCNFRLLQSEYGKRELLKGGLHPDAESIMKNYGICSFSACKDNKHLWSLYADNYKGFSVGYDPYKFLDYNNEFLARIPFIEATYVNECITDDCFEESFIVKKPLETDNKSCRFSTAFSNQKESEELFLFLCSLKEKETWMAEKEYRLIAAGDFIRYKNRLEKQGIEYLKNGYKIPIIKDCVKEIIIGHNFNMSDFLKIKEFAQRHGINKIFQTEVNVPFNLGFKELSI